MTKASTANWITGLVIIGRTTAIRPAGAIIGTMTVAAPKMSPPDTPPAEND